MDETHLNSAPKSLSLEERLQPKLDHAEYLLVLVLGIMLWTAGFVDLFTHTSQEKTVLGLYSLPHFLLLLVYSLGFVGWVWLIFPADSITWVKNGLHFIQQRAWLGLLIGVGFVAVLASMFIWERWISFPLLQASLALLILLVSGFILLTRPVPGVKIQPWRKISLAVLGTLVAVELLMQGLSFLGVLPVENTSGMFTHRGRVYQNSEGFTNRMTNQRGLYYPDFRLAEGSRRIVVTGDSFLLGLEVQPEQNLGVALEGLLAGEQASSQTEVLGLGLPGYGPGLYLDTILYPYTMGPLQPDEIIVFFHLADDFQTATKPSGQIPFYGINAEGRAEIVPQDFGLRHDLQHIIIRGYEPVNPVRTASSHLFLFSGFEQWARRLAGRPPVSPRYATNSMQISAEYPLGASTFVFQAAESSQAGQAFSVASGLLKNFHEHLQAQGVQMRLVTIPYFPADFYRTYQGSNWDSKLSEGQYDLFLPERALEEFAVQNDIPFLPMGKYMQTTGQTVEQVKNLYFKEGSGHFTPAGHQFFADAVYQCFYTPSGICPLP